MLKKKTCKSVPSTCKWTEFHWLTNTAYNETKWRYIKILMPHVFHFNKNLVLLCPTNTEWCNTQLTHEKCNWLWGNSAYYSNTLFHLIICILQFEKQWSVAFWRHQPLELIKPIMSQCGRYMWQHHYHPQREDNASWITDNKMFVVTWANSDTHELWLI